MEIGGRLAAVALHVKHGGRRQVRHEARARGGGPRTTTSCAGVARPFTLQFDDTDA